MLRTFTILFLFIFFSLAGCASQSLHVQSSPPGAEVTVISNNRSPQIVGKTPFELTAKSYPEIFTGNFQVQVSKEGYQPQIALVPKLATAGASGRLSFNLEETALPKVCQVQENAFDEMARGVAEVATFVQRKKYSEAANLVQSLITKFSGVSVLHDLQGNIFYLQKDLARALESYKRSNNLSPNNPQTLRMISRIQALQGQPVGGG